MKKPTKGKAPIKATDKWREMREARERRQKVNNAVLEPTGASPDGVGELVGYSGVAPEPDNRNTGSSLPTAAPVPNVIMAGSVELNGTHRVSLAVTTTIPGPNFLMLGITEARLLAKVLMDWAQYSEDRNNGKGA